MEEVAEDGVAIVVETTGHEASVGQDAYLLEQSLAEDLLLGGI